jgi:hypothetical protein
LPALMLSSILMWRAVVSLVLHSVHAMPRHTGLPRGIKKGVE